MRTTVGTAPPKADFNWYWTSQTASFVGDRLTGFAVPSIAILTLDATSAQVGILSAIGWLAYPTLGLVAGAALTHLPRRKVMITGELTRFALFTTIPLTALAGWVTIPQLLIVVALAGIATVFVDIAGQSYLPVVVPPGALVTANASLQSSDSLSKLTGPALAGLSLKLTGPYYGLLLSALPFLASALTRTRIQTLEPTATPGAAPSRERSEAGHPSPGLQATSPEARALSPAVASPQAMRRRIAVGLRFVMDHEVLKPLVIGAAVRSFGTGMVDAVLLLFAYRALGLSSLQGGLLIAAGSIGGLLGAFAANRLVDRFGTHRTLLLTGLEGVFWLAIPVSLVFAPAIVLVVIRVCASIWSPVWNVLTTSVRQNVTPADLQSTVHATARTVTSSTIPLGALTGGFAAGVLGGQLGTSTGLVLVLATGGAITGASVLSIRRSSQA
ncbi:MFS transporter [Kribbella sp. NPDC051620]|uniref:MFS transporter n=1 Tax=Kribbella sp. NPDC051620 TaxID=3364120 RepID=UPI0037AA4BE6